MSEDVYKAAGVDIDAGNEAAKRYARLARTTQTSGVLGRIGGFAGGFQLDLQAFPKPVLFSGTDGVGTKLKIAFELNRHHTIGIDCVAMCVNDILTAGATPLFFLDYLAVERLSVDVAEAVVGGVAEGCRLAGCALVGGETAEMPGMYHPGEYDVAGFAVGVANRDRIVDGSLVQEGHVLLGLASSGMHSNGYSLVRKIVADQRLSYTQTFPGSMMSLGEALLQPTRIYVKPVLEALSLGLPIHAMAHITGGGLIENVPRCLPEGLTVQFDSSAWSLPPLMTFLLEQSGLSLRAVQRVWNLGIGYVLVVPKESATSCLEWFKAAGETAYPIGQVIAGDEPVWN
ncbi:phosphoribosylformylglycinamidine cyclo-ligase [Alicyclobacillus tolerans]|uniref:phosphoribosylformylglycinamidine cyclo-ligase n=1 Tax=Alicyclobacillus tolerans TaxID=90970 RepID=UPI003B80A6DB